MPRLLADSACRRVASSWYSSSWMRLLAATSACSCTKAVWVMRNRASGWRWNRSEIRRSASGSTGGSCGADAWPVVGRPPQGVPAAAGCAPATRIT